MDANVEWFEMTDNSNAIAALQAQIDQQQAEIDKLKSAQPTPMPTEADAARHRDEMRDIFERRALMDAHTFYTRDQLAAMQAACPDAQAIVRDHRGAPLGPAYQVPTSQPVSNVRGPGAGGGTGWMRETPIAPPPGINHVDRLMDAQDRKDKADLIRAEAIRRAAIAKGK